MADRLLRRAAERAAREPFYLASVLLPYAQAEGLDDAGLAARVGCAADRLPAMLLCRRPAGEGAVFRDDVEAIAARFDLSAVRLARVIRSADALVALGGAEVAAARTLLTAARDHDADLLVARAKSDDPVIADEQIGASDVDSEADRDAP